MGLDWCLEKKLRQGHDPVDDEKELERLEAEWNAAWAKWLSDNGKEQPFPWPNPDSEAFAALPTSIEMATAIDAQKEKVDAAYISPMEELNAPRVGIDARATDYLRTHHNKWKHEYALDPKAMRKPPEWEDYLKQFHGRYVADLAEVRDGLSACTGIAVGPESFRGKIIGYSGEIIGERLARCAYENMTPEQAVKYGKQLLEAARKYTKKEKIEDIEKMTVEEFKVFAETSKNDSLWRVYCVFQGAHWLIFWGGRGFGIFAWS